MAEPDPVVTPFYTAELNYRERIRFLVSLLDDEELEKVLGIFAHHNLSQVPYEFWPLAAKVRAYVRTEQKRRRKLATIQTEAATA